MAELVMKYQQYAEYKDSGVEWLGEIPKGWELSKLRYMFSFGRGLTITKANLIDNGIPCINYGELHSKYGFEVDPKKHYLKCVDKEYLQSSPYALLTKGDLVFADTSEDIEGSGNFTQLITDDLVFAGYHTVIARPFDRKCSRFYAYLMDSKEIRTQIRHMVKGVKVFSITQSILKGVEIWLPSLGERETIANFLDFETAQIDTLIEKQQTLIQLLKEKRQAVISHAVTKGLNPDAPMKDSCVEWLGEVPEHWVVGRVGYYGQVLNGSTPSKANLSYWHPKEVAWLSSGEVNQYYIESPTDYISYKALKECSVTLLPVGTLVMGMIGQGKTRGTSAVTKIEATINQNLAAVIPNENLYSNYAHLFFQAAYKELREDARGGNQAALNCEIIRDFKITIPPINEQKAIFIEVNKISDKFDILMIKAEQAIQLMQERRTALISAAVTGKIDVRGWVAPDSK